jgi:drug/metabolite transporter (DMT)-like permease
MKVLAPFLFLLLATTMEATGDAVIRRGLEPNGLGLRAMFFAGGAALLFGYGLSLNLAPLEFNRVVGLYIATLFVVWQIINYMAFRTTPTFPILIGGALIVIGGLLVTFWARPET